LNLDPNATELQLCQRYFEKSYDDGTPVGTNINYTAGIKQTTNAPYRKLAASVNDFYDPNVPLKVNKRAPNGTLVLYSTDGTANNIRRDNNTNVTATLLDGHTNVTQNNMFITFSGVLVANTAYYFHWSCSSEL